MSQLDPNVVLAIGGAIVSLVTWVVHKARGDKQESFAELARSLVDQALHLAIVTADSDIGELRTKATDAAWLGLAKLNVPRNAATELLVHDAVEAGIAAALAELREHDRIVEREWAKASAAVRATIPPGIDSMSVDDYMKWLQAQAQKAPLPRAIAVKLPEPK